MSGEERGHEARREELRWSAIVERVALGGSMSPEEASFCREFEAERAAWQGLIAGLRAGAAAGAAASEAEDLAILARAQATLSAEAPSARQPATSPSRARRGWRWTGGRGGGGVGGRGRLGRPLDRSRRRALGSDRATADGPSRDGAGASAGASAGAARGDTSTCPHRHVLWRRSVVGGR
jgi:hypothetical protein